MEGMIGEVRGFAGNFAPRAWAFCDGQLLPISSNTALFSIIGTIYGGDGRTTFALPDLRGRVMVHPGNGPGLSSRRLGQKGGSETNTLNVTQIPSHNHSAVGKLKVNTNPADSSDPKSNYAALANGRVTSGGGAGGTVAANGWSASQNDFGAADGVTVTVGNTGGGQSVNNMQPWLGVNYIICMQGVFPSRN